MDRSHEIWVPGAQKQRPLQLHSQSYPISGMCSPFKVVGDEGVESCCLQGAGTSGIAAVGGCCQARMLRAGLEGDPGEGEGVLPLHISCVKHRNSGLFAR